MEIGTVVVVVEAGAVVVVVLARTVVDADAVLALESPVLTFATVVNVYAVPAVKPVIVHDPDAPMTSHLLPTPTVYTRYHAGWSPDVGAATVAVTLSMPATTVGAGGTATAALAELIRDNGNGATTAVLAMRATTRARAERKLKVFNT